MCDDNSHMVRLPILEAEEGEKMTGIPLVELARRAHCNLPTAAQAVHDMCVPKMGTAPRKNGTPAFTYPREPVEDDSALAVLKDCKNRVGAGMTCASSIQAHRVWELLIRDLDAYLAKEGK